MGMTYGNPSIARALDTLRTAGATRIIVLPLYPQYSATTTAAALDRVDAALARWPTPPGAARDRGLSRRARLHRGARGEHPRGARALRSPAVLLPRHPAALRGPWRSLRRAVPCDGAARGRTTRAARGALVGRVPVARRRRALARALHGRAAAAARACGRRARRRRLPRLRGGLPRDPRGDRDPRRDDLRRRPAGSISSTSRRSTTTRRRWTASRASSCARLGAAAEPPR